MESAHTESSRPRFNTLVYSDLFNTAIAVLLATVGFADNLAAAWVFSQCIGLTICVCVVMP